MRFSIDSALDVHLIVCSSLLSACELQGRQTRNTRVPRGAAYRTARYLPIEGLAMEMGMLRAYSSSSVSASRLENV